MVGIFKEISQLCEILALSRLAVFGSLCHRNKDIGEKHKVCKEHPQVAKSLLDSTFTFEKYISANSRPAALIIDPKPFKK